MFLIFTTFGNCLCYGALAFAPNLYLAFIIRLLGGMAAGVMLFVLMGLSPDTDVAAHLGGFIGGMLIGVPLLFLPRLARDTRTNLFAGALFSGLTIFVWWLAANAR